MKDKIENLRETASMKQQAAQARSNTQATTRQNDFQNVARLALQLVFSVGRSVAPFHLPLVMAIILYRSANR